MSARPLSTRTRWRGLIAAAIVALGSAACVAPAYNESQYQSKVAATADDAVAAIESVRLAIEAASKHDLPTNPIDVAISDQEDILWAVAGTFSSVQPPDADMELLRDQVLDLLEDAQGHVEDARIAFRDNDVETAEAAIEGAEPASKKLDDIASRY